MVILTITILLLCTCLYNEVIDAKSNVHQLPGEVRSENHATVESKLSQIEKIIHQQADQLRKQTIEIETLRHMLMDNRRTISEQQRQIATQANQIQNLEEIKKLPEHLVEKSGINRETLHPNTSDDNSNPMIQSRPREISGVGSLTQRKGRLILSGTTSTKIPAFYAYLSQSEMTPGKHQTLIFDTVKTDSTGSFSSNTGVFTVPISGIYGFIYAVRMGCDVNTVGSLQLVRNTIMEGVIFLYQSRCPDQAFVTGNAIIHANQGDEIFVRTHTDHPIKGHIYSDINGRTSFSGWLIEQYQ